MKWGGSTKNGRFFVFCFSCSGSWIFFNVLFVLPFCFAFLLCLFVLPFCFVFLLCFFALTIKVLCGWMIGLWVFFWFRCSGRDGWCGGFLCPIVVWDGWCIFVVSFRAVCALLAVRRSGSLWQERQTGRVGCSVSGSHVVN